ncbi:hypothetical protein Pla52o_48500 [Novipirellula galeiformis]|uniref:Uncharacterized protein n=1 Tax=Novipirellula galeiformis TaxID=2528004 RepID=A0A5C6C0B5_9BACT|nr:hypothetical protein Pla52o_48500 [Novipirellula galeiformis]
MDGRNNRIKTITSNTEEAEGDSAATFSNDRLRLRSAHLTLAAGDQKGYQYGRHPRVDGCRVAAISIGRLLACPHALAASSN